ncbi:MAG TPA: DUF2723 domain-containing protein [Ignavibacteria bacterium]|nr:DUF2723 domain-containing protein [Ignavibacteria bacterium]
MDRYLKHIFGFAAGIVCLVIYIITLYPGVGFMDSGELAAAAYTFGVPHPTGYPLFLVLGYIAAHMPLPGSVVYKLNLLSAIEAAAAVVITYYAALILTRYIIQNLLNTSGKKHTVKKDKKSPQNDDTPKTRKNIDDYNLMIYVLAFAAAVCTGLAKTFWLDAVQVEVYALHSVFISLIMLYCLKIMTGLNEPSRKNWIVLFILLGFSLSNHLTTIFFIPGLLYLLYLQYKSSSVFMKKVIPYVLLVIPGLLMYSVLVAASGSGPYLNWSDLSNVSNLFGHLRGADYSQLMFSSTSKFGKNAGDFFSNLPGEMAILPLVFSAAAFLLLWKSFRSFVVFVIITITFNLLYAFNYNIVDINTYYLLVFFLFGLIVPAGIIYLLSFGNAAGMLAKADEPKRSLPKVLAVSLILVVFSAAYNFKECDNSSNYANADFTVNAINSVENNAVIISYDWAYLYSGSLYYQLAEGLRPDVKIFNIKFLAVDWYLKTISKFYPDLYEGIRPQADEYLKVYGQSDKVKAPKLTALVGAFIEKCFAGFPLYITVDLVLAKETKQFVDKYAMKPVGLLYRVESKGSPYDPNAGVNALDLRYRKIEPKSPQEIHLLRVIPGMYFETAYYHYNNKNFEVSLKFLDKALEIDPGFRDALNLKKKISTETK